MPIGPMELAIILLILLFVFGAGKLPEVGSALGKSVRELRGGFKDEESSGNPK